MTKKKRTGFVPRIMVSGLATAVPACVALSSVDCGKTQLGPVALAIASFDGSADGVADVHESEPIAISLAVAAFDAAADVMDGASDGHPDGQVDGSHDGG